MWPSLLTAIFGIIDKVLPDPQAAAAAKLQAMQLQASKEGAELEAATRLQLAQSTTNTAEAASSDKYTSRWRPTIGYILGAVMAWDYILKPMVHVGYVMAGHPLPALPDLGDSQIYSMLFGMLGLGGLRIIEKIKGAA